MQISGLENTGGKSMPQGTSSEGRDILEMDYEEIDSSLLGPHAWERGKIARRDDVAIPQGSLFIWAALPLQKLLNRGSAFYRR